MHAFLLIPHTGVLSDILNYVLAKGAQYHMSQQQRKISVQLWTGREGVMRRCIHLLHALACSNEEVSCHYAS